MSDRALKIIREEIAEHEKQLRRLREAERVLANGATVPRRVKRVVKKVGGGTSQAIRELVAKEPNLTTPMIVKHLRESGITSSSSVIRGTLSNLKGRDELKCDDGWKITPIGRKRLSATTLEE